MSSKAWKYIIILLLAGTNVIYGQDLYRSGLLPGVTISKGLPSGFSLSLNTESRQSMLRGEFGGGKDWEYNYSLTDISLLGSKTLGLNYRLALGYQVRLREGLTVHRAIQQLTFVRTYAAFRAAHRFAADQSFASGLSMELRLRYRFTAEIPFSGQAADVNEFYLKINNEYLNSFFDGKYGLEIRIAPLVGYIFRDNNKLEFGPDYRIASFFSDASISSFWLSIKWYLRL